VAVLQQHRELAEERAGAAGLTLGPWAYVWSQDLGSSTPYRPDRVTGAFCYLRDRLGLGHLTFHGLRHFSATTLAGQGIGARTIAGASATPTPASRSAPTPTSWTPPIGRQRPPSEMS
jgi:hypothetical protein